MIKKLLLVPILAIFLFAGVTQAQTNDLPGPGMLPDSPLYFLKSLTENIGTFFTLGDTAKAERYLNLSERRLAEARSLIAKDRADLAEEAIKRYEKQVNRALERTNEARKRGINTDEVLVRVSEATLKHQAVLADVYERVPEQARAGIEQAMQAGMHRHEESLRAISEENREAIMENVREKSQELRAIHEKLRERGVPIPAMPNQENNNQEILEEVKNRRLNSPDQFEIQELSINEVETMELEIPNVEIEKLKNNNIPDLKLPNRP